MSIVTSPGRRASSFTYPDPFDFVHKVEIMSANRGEEISIDPDDLASIDINDLRPIRRKRSHVGAPNFSGLHFHSTLRRHVWFESRLEQQFVELTECDDSIVGVVAQPLRLHWVDEALKFHVPDYLVRHRDGRLRIVNARPAERVAKTETVFGLVDVFAESIGVEAEVFTGLDPAAGQELSFFHRYRLAVERVERPELIGALTPRWVFDQDDASLVRDMWIAIANGELLPKDGSALHDDCVLVSTGDLR